MATKLRQRLLLDIAELQENPYPNIALHVCDDDLTRACLILTPEGFGPLHLTVLFGRRYPLVPPTVTIETDVVHPNVFNNYICASILNDHTAYTPAYTLKGIAIQLLSFFGSDTLDQSYGSRYDLTEYRKMNGGLKKVFGTGRTHFVCTRCQFGTRNESLPNQLTLALGTQFASIHLSGESQNEHQNERHRASLHQTLMQHLPDEILLLILDQLETEDLTVFARAWHKVGHLIAKYDIIRTRELQCFLLKANYHQLRLGVGVAVTGRGHQKQLESEFDLLSLEAFSDHGIRHSVHHLPFQYWLPLPISYRHWQRVKDHAGTNLADIARAANMAGASIVNTLYTFMNDIVVRLNKQTSDTAMQDRQYAHASRSTLRHASEKAIESYFHLFHLLLCITTGNPSFITSANRTVQAFISGKTSKSDCPNLGHLLVALLISDVQITAALVKAIITEAITRNVVWLLDKRGANMPEMSYMEPDVVSYYRLRKTFEGSRTSYRLLMFSELFRRTARPHDSTKSLAQIRDDLFDRHGAPPRGAATRLAADVKRLHDIDDFPRFLKQMGIADMPSAEHFTAFLRHTVHASVQKGYSKWAIRPRAALTLRRSVEPGVGVAHGVYETAAPKMAEVTFFPRK